MEYVRLGSTGLEVSRVCFGTWRFGLEHDDSGVVETGREDAHELLDAFAERGGNFVDTANVYGGGDSEEWIGEWLDDRDREQFVVASKCYWSNAARFGDNLSPKNVRAEVEASLERLGTDYLDILYLHRWDDATPAQVSLRWLMDHDRFTCVPIVGARTVDQLDENVAAVDVSLSDEQFERIEDTVEV